MTDDRLVLAFFVDALGWELVRRHGGFEEVAPHRYRQRTVLGYSCAAQPTILTGKMPSEHGHWGMYYRTGRSELAPLRPLRFVPPAVANHRRFRSRVMRHHRRRSGFTGYYHLYRIPFDLFGRFDLCEKRDIYAPGAFENGTESIFDLLDARGTRYRRWTWQSGLDESFAELEREIESDSLGFAMLYTPYIDGFLHAHVGDHEAERRAIEAVDAKVRRVVDAARARRRDVRVLIFSDHGMAPTNGSADVMRRIEGLGLRRFRDYIAFYDSTMARFWFETDVARARIVEALEEEASGEILSDDDLRSEGVFFEDRRFGELVFLMQPGRLIVPSYMGKTAPAGMHGYSPDHADSYAVIMSNVELDPEPQHIRDTYGAMVRSIGAA